MRNAANRIKTNSMKRENAAKRAKAKGTTPLYRDDMAGLLKQARQRGRKYGLYSHGQFNSKKNWRG